MTCERVSAVLTLYVDEGLPARVTGRVAGHLAQCASCRTELRVLEQTLAALDRVRPQAPPLDLWEQFQRRLESQEPTMLAARGVSGSGTGRAGAVRSAKRVFNPAWLFLPRAGWHAALGTPAAVLAAVLVGLAGFAIGIRSGDAPNPPMIASVPAGPVAARSTVDLRAPLHGVSRQEGDLKADRRRLAPRAHLTEPRWGAPIAPPEAVRRASQSGLATAPSADLAAGRPAVPARAAGSTPGGTGTRIAAAPPLDSSGGRARSAGATGTVPSAVEKTTRQRVADEVVLLAQELNRAEAHTSDFFGPTGSGEPS